MEQILINERMMTYKKQFKLFVCCTFILFWSSMSYAQFCSDGIFQSIGTNTQLTQVYYDGTNYTYDNIGSPATYTYNAMGYNPADGYLYAFRGTHDSPDNQNNSVLIQIDPHDGTIVEIGTVPGLFQDNFHYYINGTFDENGNFYVRIRQENSLPQLQDRSLFKITGIASGNPQATRIGLNKVLNIADMAYSTTTGLIYTVHIMNGKFYSINPNNGNVVYIGPSGLSSTAKHMGAMIGAAGEIYGFANDGGMYQFNLATGAATLIQPTPVAGNNDAAHCVTAALDFTTDLSITKVAIQPTYMPNETVTFHVTVENVSSFGLIGVVVTDALPPGIPTANMTWHVLSSSGASSYTTGTQTGPISDVLNLDSSGVIVYEVDILVPYTYALDLVNTTTVAPPSGLIDENPADNTASATILKPQPALTNPNLPSIPKSN